MANGKSTGCFTQIAACVALLIAFRMCSSAFSGDKKPDSASMSTVPSAPLEKAAEAAPEKLAKVSAEALIAAYSANEVSADAKYKGHRLIVTGAVATVSSGMFGPTVVIGQGFNGVMASGLSKEFAGGLNKGELVELTCKATGSTLGSPTLDCSG